MQLNSEEMDFHQAVHRAVEICHSEFSAKSQKMILHLDAKHHQSTGDSVRIQQSLWNLLRNAAKFTPEKGTIIIRTSNPSPDKISMEVSDTGIGFVPVRKKIISSL